MEASGVQTVNAMLAHVWLTLILPGLLTHLVGIAPKPEYAINVESIYIDFLALVVRSNAIKKKKGESLKLPHQHQLLPFKKPSRITAILASFPSTVVRREGSLGEPHTQSPVIAHQEGERCDLEISR